MPYPKKFTSKKSYAKTYKKKQSWRKRKMAKAMSAGKKVYYFTRQVVLGTLLSDSDVATHGRYTFSMSQLPSIGEFQTLFDEYKISAIKLIFMPTAMPVVDPTNTVSTVIMPRFYTALDYTETGSNPTTPNGILEYQNCKIHSMRENMFSVYLKPCYQMEINSGSAPDQAARPTRGWLDMQNVTIQHSGVNWVFESTGGISDLKYSIKVVCKFYLALRNPR